MKNLLKDYFFLVLSIFFALAFAFGFVSGLHRLVDLAFPNTTEVYSSIIATIGAILLLPIIGYGFLCLWNLLFSKKL